MTVLRAGSGEQVVMTVLRAGSGEQVVITVLRAGSGEPMATATGSGGSGEMCARDFMESSSGIVLGCGTPGQRSLCWAWLGQRRGSAPGSRLPAA
jgi:hypothetical protein